MRDEGRPGWPGARWSWGPDPVKTVLFFALIPPLLLAGAFGVMGWSWWPRVFAGTVGMLLCVRVLLALCGAWRRGRDRRERS